MTEVKKERDVYETFKQANFFPNSIHQNCNLYMPLKCGPLYNDQYCWEDVGGRPSMTRNVFK
jgi:hypothetical protein